MNSASSATASQHPKSGDRVLTLDGRGLGTIDAVGDAAFRLRYNQGDFVWLHARAIYAVEFDTVTLICSARV